MRDRCHKTILPNIDAYKLSRKEKQMLSSIGARSSKDENGKTLGVTTVWLFDY